MLANCLQFSHIIFQFLHLLNYSYNGEGIFALDILSTLQLIISQILLACLFLLLAFGWTITKKSVENDDLDLIIPIGCFLIIMHLIIGGLIFVDTHEHQKYHDYQGVQGILMCVFRILLLLGFIVGMIFTRGDIKDPKKVPYFRHLLISGFLYLISLPVCLILCLFVAPYNQQLFLLYTTFFTQLMAQIILLYQFSAKKSWYYEASYKSESVLPHSKHF